MQVPHFMVLTIFLGIVFSFLIPLTYNWFQNEQTELKSSSVWCTSSPSGEKHCKFRNLCFDPIFEEFRFLLTSDSVISGIDSSLDWKNIDLSTVIGHNAFKMKIVLTRNASSIKSDIVFHDITPVIIMHRFKTDNLLHVVHDDLIPLHATIDSLLLDNDDSNQYTLAVTDDYPDSHLDKWYNLFSKKKLLKLRSVHSIQCFPVSYAGLLRNTLWYKYGFGEVQGPYTGYVEITQIRAFVNFSLRAWSIERRTRQGNAVNVLILVRQQTRRILNVNVIISAIEKAHLKVFLEKRSLKFIYIDLAQNETSEILSHVANADIFVGMHGAGMILSLFLPPYSSIVEIFPFAINPDHVSFMKAVCQRPSGYPLYYQMWRNTVRSNSLPGHGGVLLGGIDHLPEREQEKIRKMDEVPAVSCCHNPGFLYFMYHDTIVSEDIEISVEKAFRLLKRKKDYFEDRLRSSIFPGAPQLIACHFQNNTVNVSWGVISNLDYDWNLFFEVTLMCEDHTNIIHTKYYSYLFQLEAIGIVHVWVQPFNGIVAGNVKYSVCHQ